MCAMKKMSLNVEYYYKTNQLTKFLINNLTIKKTFNFVLKNRDVIFQTYGAEEDRKLNIEGEKLKNVISARRFVGWYNGLPNDRNLNVDLNGENVVIIGQGNVAIDVARILLSPIDKLKVSTMT